MGDGTGRYEGLDFNAPMTGETADRLVARLAAVPPGDVTDVGCGWAELLLRLLVACPGARGHGVDRDEALLERARATAAARSLDDRVTFGPSLDGLSVADLVLNVGAEHVFGTASDALDALRGLVRPGGRLLFGTLFWDRTPTPELEAELGRLPSLADLVDAAVERGWRPLDLLTASTRDWDRFEFGFLADWEQVVMASTDRDASAAAREASDRHRDGYLARRGVLGFACLTLGHPLA